MSRSTIASTNWQKFVKCNLIQCFLKSPLYANVVSDEISGDIKNVYNNRLLTHYKYSPIFRWAGAFFSKQNTLTTEGELRYPMKRNLSKRMMIRWNWRCHSTLARYLGFPEISRWTWFTWCNSSVLIWLQRCWLWFTGCSVIELLQTTAGRGQYCSRVGWHFQFQLHPNRVVFKGSKWAKANKTSSSTRTFNPQEKKSRWLAMHMWKHVCRSVKYSSMSWQICAVLNADN